MSSDSASFFNGHLSLRRSQWNEFTGDVLVVPSCPDILEGGDLSKEVFAAAGEDLRLNLRPYTCLEPGACKLTAAMGIGNFKHLAFCILPELYEDEGLSRLGRVKVAMCVADALDLSAESTADTVVFTHWPIASVDQSAEILLLCIAHWMRTKPVYAERLREIIILVDNDELFNVYYNVAGLIEDDPSLVLDVLQESAVDDSGDFYYSEREINDSLGLDFADVKYSVNGGGNVARAQHDRRFSSQDGSSPNLFYSRNLSTSILSIEQPDGTIRQYRLSTTVLEKNTHYFRCSRCDYLSTRANSDVGQFRPKITVRDGHVVSDRFPNHHPFCEGMSKETFVLQQLDRLWKAIAIYETDELRQSYVRLRSIAPKEADALYNEMEDPQGNFPEWEALRQTAEKFHHQYSLRLIKCSPQTQSVMGVNIRTYSAIRRVEGEIDGVKDSPGVAWLTEGVIDEKDIDVDEEINVTAGPSNEYNDVHDTKEGIIVVDNVIDDSEVESGRPHRTIRPTLKVREQQQYEQQNDDVGNPMRFRIVRQNQKPSLKRPQV